MLEAFAAEYDGMSAETDKAATDEQSATALSSFLADPPLTKDQVCPRHAMEDGGLRVAIPLPFHVGV